jgi:hypothetical protein
MSEIGVDTGNRMKFALYSILKSHYEGTNSDPGRLAADIVNYLFENEDAFYSSCKNHDLAEQNAKALRGWADEPLCMALSCAAYNHCYGEYVRKGGRIGFCGSKFLGYFRAFQSDDFASVTHIFEKMSARGLGNSVLPFMALKAAGLWRNLPNDPNPNKLAAIVRADEADAKVANGERKA